MNLISWESLLLAAIAIPAALGAQAGNALAFEVASIKATVPPPEGGFALGRFRETPAGIDYSSISIYTLILKAYGIQDFQLSTPRELSDLTSKRWDIVARLPPNSSKEQIPLMLRTLLADRFKLTLHRESKELPIYALIVAKGGPKLKEAPPPETAMGGSRSPSGGVRLQGRATLGLLAQTSSSIMRRPVIDATGISGVFDITLEYARDEAPALGDGGDGAFTASLPGQNFQRALEDVLGLKLEARKSQFEILTVEHVEAPTAN